MRRIPPILAAALAGLVAAPLAAVPTQASTVDPSLAPTPYQGWNTYYGLGVDFTEDEVIDMAQTMKDRGLLDAGYDIVWLDGGWQAEEHRDANGDLQPDPDQFPSGMNHLTDTLHEMGFKAGIYTDAGAKLTDDCGLGSGGGYQQRDADQFAEWGFDAVKVDFLCGWANDEDPQEAFTAMSEAIRNNASGRDMIFNLCNPVTSPYWGDYPEEKQSIGSWAYAPEIAESWRTYTDVGFIGQIRFADVLRNYDANAAHPEVAGPGAWSDPDYLGPELGMSDTEFRTQMSLWAVAAAPLVIASDVAELSETSIDILSDPDVLAVNQDELGYQARRVSQPGDQEVWVKQLADGSRAVVLLNRSSSTAEVSTSVREVGLNGSRVAVKDLWTKEKTEANGTIRATVEAHGAVLLHVERATNRPGESRVVVGEPAVTAVDDVTIPGGPTEVLAPTGATITVKVPVHNDGTRPATDVEVAADVPDGWQVSGDGELGRIRPGGTALAEFSVSVPADAERGDHGIEFRASVDGSARETSAIMTVTVADPAPSGTANLAHHPWVSATSGWMEPTIDRSVGGWSGLKIAGQDYETGIGVASPSSMRWYLGGECSTFTGGVGIDDAVKFDSSGATVTYQIIGDGETLFETDVMVRDEFATFDVDVSGVRDLRLVVGDGGDGGHNDRANWVNLEVTCG